MRINVRVWQFIAFGMVAGATFAVANGLIQTPDQEIATPSFDLAVDPGEVAQITVPPGAVTDEAGVTTASTSPLPDTDPDIFFVSATIGDDANDGQTAEAPWASLQGSMDRLTPGQTLYVMDGRYSDQTEPGVAHYVMNVDGTPDAWITIAAAPGHQPELVPTAGNGMSIRGNYVEVSGLRVRGEGFSEENHYGWGLLVRSSHHVRLVGNTISDMPVGGISAVESTNLEFYENEVFDNSFWGPEQGSGISVWHSRDHGTEPSADGYHDRIIGNVVYRNEAKVFSMWAPGQNIITDGNGIIVDEAKELGYTGRTLVANNVVFDNGGRGILVHLAVRVDVVFNTTYNNGRTEDLAGGAVEIAATRSFDVHLLNNLAWARSGVPALTVDGSSEIVMGGNVLITDSPSGQSTELDLVTTDDPGLVAPGIDPETADFRPRPDSLVIDRAIDVEPLLGFDADGNSRPPIDADVGAYELLVS